MTTRNPIAAFEPVVRFVRGLMPLPDEERLALPSRPGRQDVPPEAWAGLEPACGQLAPDRLLLIPGSWKRGSKVRQGVSRTRVVAFGETAVGQWTDGEDEGTIESVPLEDLLAIDDRIVLLHGRLLLIGKAGRLTIPYNAVARPQLRENVMWLRRLIAGPEFATRRSFVWITDAAGERPEHELPYKWAYMLGCRNDLRIDPQADEMVAVGNVVEIGRSRGPATGISVLGPRELVVAAEPPNWLFEARYGVDLTVVPRAYIRDVSWSRGELRIRLRAPDGSTDGLEISRPLDENLVEAMRRSFGEAVTWA